MYSHVLSEVSAELRQGQTTWRRHALSTVQERVYPTIPDDGLAVMQKNVFMDKLLHARKRSVGEEASRVLCDACSSDEARLRRL